MGISMYSTPAFLQASISSASMGLEASEIWVSPWQKASKPSLVPAPPTSMRASGFSSRNSSAVAWVIGCTVLQPSITISPETVPPPPPPWPPAALPPQAARTNDSTKTDAMVNSLERAILLNTYAPFVPSRLTHHEFKVPDRKIRDRLTRLSGRDDRAQPQGCSCSYVNVALNLG